MYQQKLPVYTNTLYATIEDKIQFVPPHITISSTPTRTYRKKKHRKRKKEQQVQ